MEFALKPMASETMFEGEGGAYYTWSSSKYPLLGKANVGAGQLVLQPHGFALPHYSDSSKVGFVLQGTDGVVGIVLPNTTKEVVLKLRKGDLIPVPSGAVSWWFNNGESEFIVLFIGETSEAHIPGQFTYFLLTGTQGVLRGFSSEVLSKAYNLNKDETNKLTKSQNGALIIKLQNCQTMPSPQMDKTKQLVYNTEEPENYVKNGGFVRIITEKSFPFVGQVGLSFVRVKLEPNAIKAPVYEASGCAELIYIAKGSGKVEIVGMNGKPEMDTQVKEGDLLVVPQYFVISEIAGDQGMECISILKTPKPALEELAGKGSIWEAISPVVQEAAFNVDPKFVKLFLSKISNSSNLIIAPTN